MSRVITMRRFGQFGRWGNQLLQYAFLKLYSEEHDCELQLPPWAGNDLLCAKEPPVTCDLPEWKEPTIRNSHLHQGMPPEHDELVNKDFAGYAQYHTSWFAKWKTRFRQLFRARVKHHEPLRDDRDTWIGVHLRRGDYGQLCFYITPVEWYFRKLEELWPTVKRPRLFIATEDKSLVQEFADYNPVTAEDLGVVLHDKPLENYPYLKRDLQVRDPSQLDFYPDFSLLTQCQVMLAPNSTFSFVAAMLSRNVIFYRSHMPTQSFRREDPWHAYPLQHDSVEDYPDIPGVRCTTNPYW